MKGRGREKESRKWRNSRKEIKNKRSWEGRIFLFMEKFKEKIQWKQMIKMKKC